MVKRFSPEISYKDCYSEYDTPEAICVESRYGKYVLLETYKDEQHRLNNQIDRLKAQIEKLHLIQEAQSDII